MSPLALLLAAGTVLSNADILVPASHWTAVRLIVGQPNTVVDGSFRVIQGSRVQLLIADRRQAERFHRGRSFAPMYSSGFHSEFRFQTTIGEPGEYILLIDNRIDARGPAKVELSLNQSVAPHVIAGELPPARRRAVVALSALFFGSVVFFSARQFLKRH